MGSAARTHTAPREVQAVQEVARELARDEESPGARRRFGQREHQARLQGGALRRLRDWLAGRPLDDATLAECLAAAFDTENLPCELTIIEVTGEIIEL